MFYYIRGLLTVLEPIFAVVEAGGIGYKLSISQTTFDRLPSVTTKPTPEVKLLTYLAVRENDIELFGFSSEEELSAFKMLLQVSGVGPKMALSVLSTLTPERFALAVCTDDTKAISKASGVGSRTAARIILELKDKLNKGAAAQLGGLPSDRVTAPVGKASGGAPTALSEAIDALMVLGYSRPEATAALSGADASMELEEMIRYGLKQLMKL